MKSRKEIRGMARAALRGSWTQAVLATLVLGVLTFGSSFSQRIIGIDAFNPFLLLYSSITILLAIFIQLPMTVGYTQAFLKLLHHDEEDVFYNAFDGFRNYVKALSLGLLKSIFVCLWSLLLLIPGIIKRYAYAMTYYISLDHPELSANDCIDLSKEMMRGHKWELFVLDLSFLGWMLLCIPTLGIGMFWVTPYMQTARATFYEELKAADAAPTTEEPTTEIEPSTL